MAETMAETDTTEDLHLRAESLDDLAPLSALAQDMVLRCADIAWDAKGRRLVLIGNRYRHEDPKRPSRCRAGLTFSFVESAKRRGWPADPETPLVLLGIIPESLDTLVLAFGGGADIRLKVEVVDATLDDLSGPWGAKAVPKHER